MREAQLLLEAAELHKEKKVELAKDAEDAGREVRKEKEEVRIRLLRTQFIETDPKVSYITNCPRSSDPLYIVTFYINWVTT